jgi:hypothetical protein
MMFDRLTLQDDRVLLDDLVFRLESSTAHGRPEPRDDCFLLYKTRSQVDQFARFFHDRDFRPKHVFELGIWDGGSVAFWFETFKPEKHVAIDILRRGDSPNFRRYKDSKRLDGRIKTYWGTDQADRSTLRRIVQAEFRAELDLIVDDASHVYEWTKTSFETLFPLLRAGGLYIVEDWSWAYYKEFQVPTHPMAAATDLTRLIFDLVRVAGGPSKVITSVTVFQGFAVVERGPLDLPASGFKLDDFIVKRPRFVKLRARVTRSATRARRKSTRTLRGVSRRLRGGAETGG